MAKKLKMFYMCVCVTFVAADGWCWPVLTKKKKNKIQHFFPACHHTHLPWQRYSLADWPTRPAVRQCLWYITQNTVNDVEDSTEFEYETAIYYGDSTVNVGERFSITCIIPITDPINWLKDGEAIKVHNLRHGHDEHSYVLSESAIEGEFCQHKIPRRIKALQF